MSNFVWYLKLIVISSNPSPSFMISFWLGESRTITMYVHRHNQTVPCQWLLSAAQWWSLRNWTIASKHSYHSLLLNLQLMTEMIITKITAKKKILNSVNDVYEGIKRFKIHTWLYLGKDLCLFVILPWLFNFADRVSLLKLPQGYRIALSLLGKSGTKHTNALLPGPYINNSASTVSFYYMLVTILLRWACTCR